MELPFDPFGGLVTLINFFTEKMELDAIGACACNFYRSLSLSVKQPGIAEPINSDNILILRKSGLSIFEFASLRCCVKIKFEVLCEGGNTMQRDSANQMSLNC